jgi:hypothetical protein
MDNNSKVLYHLLREFFEPEQIKKMDEWVGYAVNPIGTQWDDYTFITAYADGSYKDTLPFSIFHAIPDIWSGVDIDDEKPLIKGGTVEQCRAAIKEFLTWWTGETKPMLERKGRIKGHLV